MVLRGRLKKTGDESFYTDNLPDARALTLRSVRLVVVRHLASCWMFGWERYERPPAGPLSYADIIIDFFDIVMMVFRVLIARFPHFLDNFIV